MHKRSLATKGRAVAPYAELLEFLATYIEKNEPGGTSAESAEDQAESFLRFIKVEAGLLIEAGDGLYSFIHMTFQEYLSATHLTSYGEMDGARSIWAELGGGLDNPRWREVVRLLVASLRSINGQKFFVEELLKAKSVKKNRDRALLLMGLLRDGIEPAEQESFKIVTRAVETILQTKNVADIVSLQASIKAWCSKDKWCTEVGEGVINTLFDNSRAESILVLGLLRVSLNLSPFSSERKNRLVASLSTERRKRTFRTLILGQSTSESSDASLDALHDLHDLWATESPQGNAAAAIGMGVSLLFFSTGAERRLLRRELVMRGTGEFGPDNDQFMNLLGLAVAYGELPQQLMKALDRALAWSDNPYPRDKSVSRSIEKWTNGLLVGDTDSPRIDRIRRDLRGRLQQAGVNNPLQKSSRRKDGVMKERGLDLILRTYREKLREAPGSYWQMIRSSEIFSDYLVPSLEQFLELIPKGHWQEALRVALEENVPAAIARFFAPDEWAALARRLEARKQTDGDVDFAAWLILLDLWVWERDGHELQESPLKRVAHAAQGLVDPILRFLLSVREVCDGTAGAGERIRDLTKDPQSDVIQALASYGWASTDEQQQSIRQRNSLLHKVKRENPRSNMEN